MYICKRARALSSKAASTVVRPSCTYYDVQDSWERHGVDATDTAAEHVWCAREELCCRAPDHHEAHKGSLGFLLVSC